MKDTRTISQLKAAETYAAARSITSTAKDVQHTKTERLKAARLKREAALDEALDESFPASDPVELGHSEHVGRARKGKCK